MIVGAHDGSKLDGYIRDVANMGTVLLVEPVPFLFERLRERFGGHPRIRLRNCAVSTKDGEAEFTAPTQSANSVVAFADQLGSLLPDHAVAHASGMSRHLEVIRVQALTFATLMTTEQISSIDVLMTDTEGMDAELLPTFPFSAVMPKNIIFEFKHSDGVLRVGRKLANLLIMLDDLDYRVYWHDPENLMAVHNSGQNATPSAMSRAWHVR